MFTKRHYEKIAQTLKDERMTIDHELSIVTGLQITESAGKRKQWANQVETFAFMFQSDKPRFNRDRFLAACGYND